MAKQSGDFVFTGTIDDLTFYRMEGRYYVRRKSSLSGKRFHTDASFAGSRQSSSRFGEGNRLASTLYRMIPKEKRQYALFCFLKRESILLLKEGRRSEDVRNKLKDYLIYFGFLSNERIPSQPKVWLPAARERVAGPRTAKMHFYSQRTFLSMKTGHFAPSLHLLPLPTTRYSILIFLFAYEDPVSIFHP